MTVDAAGNLVIADYGDNRVRVVAASDGSYYGQPMTGGDIYTIAGTGAQGFSGDGGPATSATLHYPQGVTADGTGNVLVTDSGNNRVRMITGSNPGARTGRPAATAGRPGSAGTRRRAARTGHAARAGDPATAGPYVTLLFSRTETGAADNCVPDNSGIAPLDTVVAPVPPLARNDRHRHPGHRDDPGDGSELYPLRRLTHLVLGRCGQPGDGLRLVVRVPHGNVPGPARQADADAVVRGNLRFRGRSRRERATRRARAHRLPGEQNPPLALQANYGANCFAWGQEYNKSGMTLAAAGATPPYWQETVAVNGGACHVQTAPCYTVAAGTNGHLRYDEPSTIIAKIQALQPGQWFTLQVYILVTGSNPGYSHNATRWDCTSPDPALHWTNDNERYCYSDWQQIVTAIAAMPDVTVTDPLTVGVAFGRPAS